MNDAAFRRRYETIRVRIEQRLKRTRPARGAARLREGCRYALQGGGKRVRPALLVLACEAVGGRAAASLDAAAAIEIMHNFTLVHDDIMDNADARRGRPTVHRAWSANDALLVGDVLVGASYESLLRTKGPAQSALAGVLTRGLLDVCEGQALDLEFEKRSDVTVREYFRMIGKKTGALLATAAELGALLGGGTPARVAALRRFGLRLGIAFQVQDDLLDVVGDPAGFGKTIGGDILEGKRTYLLLTAAARAAGSDRDLIARVMAREGSPGLFKSTGGAVTPAGRSFVEDVRRAYGECGAIDDARGVVRRTTRGALRELDRLPRSTAREMLRWLADELVHRAT
ncbi:MAG TPA: polyprenyl synthetase family protein [Bacteroidota bacterium]|nr:polyprenyl synthetase family protein [Bacteroidota bacterium]